MVSNFYHIEKYSIFWLNLTFGRNVYTYILGKKFFTIV